MSTTDDQVAVLANAIRAIAHGPVSGATGLELLAMAVGGRDRRSVVDALDGIASALLEVAGAIRDRDGAG